MNKVMRLGCLALTVMELSPVVHAQLPLPSVAAQQLAGQAKSAGVDPDMASAPTVKNAQPVNMDSLIDEANDFITIDPVQYKGFPFLAYTGFENWSGRKETSMKKRAKAICQFMGYSEPAAIRVVENTHISVWEFSEKDLIVKSEDYYTFGLSPSYSTYDVGVFDSLTCTQKKAAQ